LSPKSKKLWIRIVVCEQDRRGEQVNVCYFLQDLTDAICYYLFVIQPLERLVAHSLYKDPTIVQNYNLFLYIKNGKRMIFL